MTRRKRPDQPADAGPWGSRKRLRPATCDPRPRITYDEPSARRSRVVSPLDALTIGLGLPRRAPPRMFGSCPPRWPTSRAVPDRRLAQRDRLADQMLRPRRAWPRRVHEAAGAGRGGERTRPSASPSTRCGPTRADSRRGQAGARRACAHPRSAPPRRRDRGRSCLSQLRAGRSRRVGASRIATPDGCRDVEPDAA